ncbi:MAG: CotH kinase family protein [Paludibacteraceae bacterium]|nr:CotH kinase family protein [Paludibacteraceae bacterium]
MKNFTKQNIKTCPLWIRLLIMTFMLLIGTGSAWAVNNVSGGYIYFDNSTTKWTDSSIQFVIGHNSYSRTYVMKKLSNSNVYYYKLDDAQYHTWGDATYYAVIGTSSKWGDGSWGSSNLSNATHRTAAYTNPYDLNSGSTYCFTPSSSNNGASLTISNSYPNTTNRAYVYSVSSGSTASSSNASAGTVKVAGYYISSQGTTSSRSATSSASTYSASSTFVRGTTITMSVASTGSGYTFKGWYSSSTASSGNLLGTSTSYTYTSSGSSTKTVYAVFEANPTVVISETGGTGTVKLGPTTLSTSATSMASGSYELSITAPANYNVSSVSVSGGSLSTPGTTGSSKYTGTVNVSANTTINITYAKACDDVAAPTLSIEQEIVDNCGSVTNGIIAISNYANFSGCTFTLNGDAVTPTNEGKINDVTASGTCTVVATNSCGNKNTAEITMTKTTVKAPRTDFEVSLSYPQVGFAQNTGSVNIDLSGSERNVTYYLYKNGRKVDGSDQLGEGKALRWTVSSTGSYTVKADNPCNGEIAMTGQVDFTCMSNLKLAFEGDKSVFCPGETANIIVTFNGTGKGDENTNPGKYGWQWTTDNITYTSVYLTESGVKVPVTIKGDGSISLSVRSCDGTVNSDELTFTTHKIVTPDIKFTPNPVKEGTVTVLSIENYDPNNTYEFNCPDELQGTMTQTTEFELSAGSYAFTVTAASKECPLVTATSEPETLTVKEGGVAIDILGDAAIYNNDPTDFVAMYVTEKNGMADFPDAEGIAISSYTWEYSTNGTSNWAACKEYDNATLGVKNSGSKCNNLRPNKVGYYRCVISYIDGAKNNVGSLTSNVLQVTQAGTNPNTSSGKNQHIKSVGGNWTLPVISVNTGDNDFPTCSAGSYPSAQTDKLKKKRSVDVKIFNPDGTVYYDRKARMNYRGSSSLNFKKKSYAFCPGEENCGDDEKGVDYVKTSKENLFGLSNGAKDKDWVLYAAAADPSLMRNRVVFNTFKEMTGKWGVDTKYVELVVNGVYQGVYVLMDKITVNENRVNITDKNGFIVKFDKTDKEDREKSLLEGGMEVGDEKTFMTTRTGRLGITTYGTKVDQLFEIEYPEKEDIEDEGGSWAVTLNFIKQKFEQFETALAKSDYATVRNLIDYQSWADWFIINEYTKNVDAYRASCVFVYNGDKIEVMPLWDQELSFNNQAGADIWKKGCDKTDGLLIQHEGVYTDCFPAPFWFIGKTVNFGSCGGNNGSSTITGTIGGYLINDACFVNTIKQRWSYHMQNSLSSTELKKKVDAYTSELTTAIKRESKRWSDDFRCNAECGGGTGYNSQSYDNSLKTLNEWITGNRTTNLTAAISNLNGASSAGITITMEPTTGITTPWVPVKVLVNAPTSATIKYDDTSITEGITEKKDKAIKTVNDNLYTYIFPRPTSWGTGNVATPIEQKTYEIRAIMTNASDDCPGVSNEAVATIKLADEGNDNCVENK